MCRHGVVATSQPLAALAGAEALQGGGTAMDAAVVAAAVLNVVEPMSTGIGGDAFAIFCDAKSRRLTAINGSGRSPKAATYDEIKRRLNGESTIPSTSPLTWMVPGTVDAWVTALQLAGRMSLGDALAPAIRYAEEGFAVAPQTAATWMAFEKALAQPADTARTWLYAGHRAPRPGEIFRCPNLAKTLRAIAEGGRDVFYRGVIAEAIVAFSESAGGLFSLDDFEKHASDFPEVLRSHYRGLQVVAFPPNSQGIAALEALQILEGTDITGMQHNSAELLHRQIEAMKIALWDAHQFVADVPVSSVAGLLSRTYVDSRREQISLERAATQPAAATGGDTVYVCAVDREGNAASFINSVYMPWGSSYTVPGTGILLQNRGHCFSLDSQSPNVIGPRKRSRHTLAPAMVLSDNRPLLVFGFVGGDMQVQAQVQFMCNVVDFGMNVQDALDAPRWRYNGTGASIAVEAGVPRDVELELSKRRHEISCADGFFGGGQAILVDPENGTLQAGSDSRRDGCAIGY